MKFTTPLILFTLLALPLCAEETKTVKLTLSPETTYLIEPQLSDGRIDYLAALNKQLAAQTTPEKNLLAGVFSLITGEEEAKLLTALPETATEEHKRAEEARRTYRERFWKMIGADAPPLNSLVDICPVYLSTKDYEKTLLEFYSKADLTPMVEQQREREKHHCKSLFDDGKMTKEEYEAEIKRIETETPDWYYRDIIQDQWIESWTHTWTAKEYPYLAKWLATTDDLTSKLIAMSQQRTGYYHPCLSYQETSQLPYSILLPYVQSLRYTARFFSMRGNFEFARGNVDQAMECGFASVRMGRTMRTGAGSIVEDLVGIAMTSMANYQLTTYLADLPKETKAAWILQKKREYDAIETAIGPLPRLPIWCSAERFGALAVVQTLAIEPDSAHGFFKDILDATDDAEFLAQYEQLFASGKEYDWNEILKRVNFVYDGLEDIYLLPNWQRRLRAAKRFEQHMDDYADSANETPERKMSAFLCKHYIIPSVEPVTIALTRIEWDSRITSVSFALAAYRADSGGYPDTLAQLVPKYLDKVPDSPFTDKPLRYIKRSHDILITNDDAYKLDGSEEEVEAEIAEAQPGGRAFPSARSFMFVVTKF